MANDNIKADMVETSGYPHLVNKYDVQGVPHTVINEDYYFRGAAPELELAKEVLRALGKLPPRIEETIEYEPGHEHQHEHEHEHEE